MIHLGRSNPTASRHDEPVTHTTEKALGRKIRSIRMKRKLTQQSSADSYGCSLRWWQSFEQGKSVSVNTLQRIGKTLDVEAWELMKG